MRDNPRIGRMAICPSVIAFALRGNAFRRVRIDVLIKFKAFYKSRHWPEDHLTLAFSNRRVDYRMIREGFRVRW
jgi:hypothetical protein